MRDTRVVAVSGSRRDGSHTRKALRHALAAAADAGADTELLDLREWDLPEFDPNLDEDPAVVAEFKRKLREADAVLLGSPVYHGSYSSTVKTALDWSGFDEFDDTTVGLLALAGGGSYASTLDHLRVVVRGVHGWVLPHQVGIRNGYEKFDEDGEFVDESLAERTAKLGREAVRYAHIERSAAEPEAGTGATAGN